ncbi:hypothetical protein ACN26Y_21480 [Micromonospora sp. WMMD558]|uniref:hypothetical protein n=1 Tax=Micromonospora sp. WMMD558 TaxID=3403462 RepID=UPI003BF516D4
MERAEVVVRQSFRRNGRALVGVVLSGGNGRYRVRWEDSGEEEELQVGGQYRWARRGSLRHQFLVDPQPLRASFAEGSTDFILRLLREQRSAMTVKRITEELCGLGLDSQAVKKAWPAAKRAIDKCDQVHQEGRGTGRTYKWIGPDDEAADTVAAATTGSEAVPETTPAPATHTSDDGVAEQTPISETVVGDGAAGSDLVGLDASDPAPVESVSTEPAAAPPGQESPVGKAAPKEVLPRAAQPSLAERIADLIGDVHPAKLRDYVLRPLATGARFGEADSQRIDDFLGALTEHDREVAESLLLALPRQSAAIDGTRRRKPIAGSVVEPVLAAAAEEFRGYAEPEPGVLAAAAWLLRRASAVDDLPGSAAAALISLIIAVASARREQDIPVLDAAAGALGRLLPALSRDERTGLDLTGLAQAVAHLPLSRDGGRAALLAAIAKFRSKALLSPEWWEGVTVDALAECATGPLGGVTSRPEIVEQYVGPLVARELSRVTSRTRLGFLLGLPGEFVSNLPADGLAAAFRRVAGDDQVVAGLVGALAQERRIEALRQDVERAHADVAAAEQRVEAAERRAAALADRCDRLEESLRAEHRQAASLRSAQDRQIQIDIIRSLADLAAEVEELAAEQTAPEVLVERVRALVSAQALEPVGQAGQKLAFDPTTHEPIVGAPGREDAVTVIRPGYRWCPSGEDVLIEKALVTTT